MIDNITSIYTIKYTQVDCNTPYYKSIKELYEAHAQDWQRIVDDYDRYATEDMDIRSPPATWFGNELGYLEDRTYYLDTRYTYWHKVSSGLGYRTQHIWDYGFIDE